MASMAWSRTRSSWSWSRLALEQRAETLLGARHDIGRGAPHAGGGMRERAGDGLVVIRAEQVERPQRVQGAAVHADGIHFAIGDQRAKLRRDICFSPLHEQPLRMLAPEQVIRGKRGEERGRIVHSQLELLRGLALLRSHAPDPRVIGAAETLMKAPPLPSGASKPAVSFRGGGPCCMMKL